MRNFVGVLLKYTVATLRIWIFFCGIVWVAWWWMGFPLQGIYYSAFITSLSGFVLGSYFSAFLLIIATIIP